MSQGDTCLLDFTDVQFDRVDVAGEDLKYISHGNERRSFECHNACEDDSIDNGVDVDETLHEYKDEIIINDSDTSSSLVVIITNEEQ